MEKNYLFFVFEILIISSIIFIFSPLAVSIDWSDPTVIPITVISSPACNQVIPAWCNWNNAQNTWLCTDSSENCYKDNGRNIKNLLESKTSCCNQGYECNIATGKCMAPIRNMSRCQDYNTEIECINNVQNTDVFQELINYYGKSAGFCSNIINWVNGSGGSCYNITVCGCFWASNSCRVGWQDSLIGCDYKIYGNCTYTTIEYRDDCNTTGLLYYSWNATWKGFYSKPTSCAGGSKQISCRPSVKLTFFTLLNMIIAILIITAIYFAYFLLKKKKKR